MAETVHIQGLSELGKFFRTYPEKVAKRAIMKPNAIAAKTISAIAKGLAPMYHGDVQKGHPPPGTLKKAIQIKHVTGLPWWRIQYIVFVRHGFKFQSVGKKQVNLDAYYWWWVEFGTAKMDAHPFLGPAFESSKEPVLAVLLENLNKAALDLAKKEGWGRLNRKAPVLYTPPGAGA